jgi:hypothetical protein
MNGSCSKKHLRLWRENGWEGSTAAQERERENNRVWDRERERGERGGGRRGMHTEKRWSRARATPLFFAFWRGKRRGQALSFFFSQAATTERMRRRWTNARANSLEALLRAGTVHG